VKRRRREPLLLLASTSPRRRQLLSDAGFRFRVVRSKTEERFDPCLTARELTIWNALRKGLVVARRNPAAVVLAADTLVSLNGRVIGKPRDMPEAGRILGQLNGQTHQVSSAVFLACFAQGIIRVFHETSHVTFKRLGQRQLEDYLAMVEPLDKAGAYAAQGSGGSIIQRIDGSRSNVVGLPMRRTRRELARVGVKPGRA